MNQHKTFIHHLRSSSKSQSVTPKRSGSIPSAFLHLLSGTLCHLISEILLPFRCLNPDSKLTCSRQLSASRISAVFSPPAPPPPLPAWMCFLSVLVVSRSLRGRMRMRESAGSGRGEESICANVRAREGQRAEREREGKKGRYVCVCVCVCVYTF